jgi:hypothetical protein
MARATVRANARALPKPTRRIAAKRKVRATVLAKAVDDHPVARLSFVQTFARIPRGASRGRCFWNVKPSSDPIADDVRGTNAALEYLAYEASPSSSEILQLIVADMPQTLGTAERAFLVTVARAAVAGVHRGFDLRKRTYAELEQKIFDAMRAMSTTPEVAA